MAEPRASRLKGILARCSALTHPIASADPTFSLDAVFQPLKLHSDLPLAEAVP